MKKDTRKVLNEKKKTENKPLCIKQGERIKELEAEIALLKGEVK